jgi:hypothetical protein
MTGPEHYREAERLLLGSGETEKSMVHATLALAAATALSENSSSSSDLKAWIKIAGEDEAERARQRDATEAPPVTHIKMLGPKSP